MQFLAFNSGISNDGSMKLHSDETLSSRILDFLARDSDKCFFVMRLSPGNRPDYDVGSFSTSCGNLSTVVAR